MRIKQQQLNVLVQMTGLETTATLKARLISFYMTVLLYFFNTKRNNRWWMFFLIGNYTVFHRL